MLPLSKSTSLPQTSDPIDDCLFIYSVRWQIENFSRNWWMNGSIENELWIVVFVLFNVFIITMIFVFDSNQELTIPPRPNYMLSFRFVSFFIFSSNVCLNRDFYFFQRVSTCIVNRFRIRMCFPNWFSRNWARKMRRRYWIHTFKCNRQIYSNGVRQTVRHNNGLHWLQ